MTGSLTVRQPSQLAQINGFGAEIPGRKQTNSVDFLSGFSRQNYGFESGERVGDSQLAIAWFSACEGFSVQDIGCIFQGLGLRIRGSGCKVQGLESRFELFQQDIPCEEKPSSVGDRSLTSLYTRIDVERLKD